MKQRAHLAGVPEFHKGTIYKGCGQGRGTSMKTVKLPRAGKTGSQGQSSACKGQGEDVVTKP